MQTIKCSERPEYFRSEWELFAADPVRARASLEAVGRRVSLVLDIGCGAGQEMLPFVQVGAFGAGVDIHPAVGVVGREMFARAGLATRVAFARSGAECLPFADNAFDVVICRLALPYTDNAKALAEMARVLVPNGVLLLKIHHATFYVHQFWTGFRSGRVPSMVNAVRVLTSGMVYLLTGKQRRNRLLTHETFQTRWMLERELAKNALVIRNLMPDSNGQTPSFVIGRATSSKDPE